jgi:hypothetical protein
VPVLLWWEQDIGHGVDDAAASNKPLVCWPPCGAELFALPCFSWPALAARRRSEAVWVVHGVASPGRPWRRGGVVSPPLHGAVGGLLRRGSQARSSSSSGHGGIKIFFLTRETVEEASTVIFY